MPEPDLRTALAPAYEYLADAESGLRRARTAIDAALVKLPAADRDTLTALSGKLTNLLKGTQQANETVRKIATAPTPRTP